MEKKVLVIGGGGRIGGSVAQDILAHTNSKVIVTSRNPQTKVTDYCFPQAKAPIVFS